MLSKEFMNYLFRYSEEFEVVEKEEKTEREIAFKDNHCSKLAFVTVHIQK